MDVRNPFVVSRDVPEEYFCDRTAETRALVRQIENGRSVALISPRRLGKTGLIHHLFRQPQMERGYHLFFIDLYSTTSMAELVVRLGREVYGRLASRGEQIARGFLRAVRSLGVGLTLDADTGMPLLRLAVGDIAEPQTTLDEILAYLEAADRPCIVAIDEFQRIADYRETNVEALLRTKVQQCRNTLFIYSGSKRHVMSMMFTSSARPFYNSAMTMGLAPIAEADYAAFAKRMFERFGKRLADGVAEAVHRRFDGYTWFVQVVMNELFAGTSDGGLCTERDIERAIVDLIALNDMVLEETLLMLSQRQRALVYAIAEEGRVAEPGSAAFIARHKLASPSSVQAALKPLTEKDIVARLDDGSYRLENFFLTEKIRRNI